MIEKKKKGGALVPSLALDTMELHKSQKKNVLLESSIPWPVSNRWHAQPSGPWSFATPTPKGVNTPQNHVLVKA